MKRTAQSKSSGWIPAVAYCRMSSRRQDKSIAEQRDEIEKFAAAKGYRIVRWYIDEGISGDDTENRDEFRRLLGDSASGEFVVVLCWDQERFGRFDSLEAGYWIKPLRDARIKVITVADGPIEWDDFEGRIMYTLKQEAKHQFLRDLARNTMRGKAKSWREGKWIARPPFGYAKDSAGRLVLGEPEKVSAVAWMFEQYATTDTSIRALQLALNERGVAGPKGAEWNSRSVLNILKNPAYHGAAVANRQNRGKYFAVRGGDIQPIAGGDVKPEADWITLACPVIVELDTWDAVQAKLSTNRRRTSPRLGRGPYLLADVLHCGHCGERMTGLKLRSGRLAYVCGRYHRLGAGQCHANTITESPIVAFLASKIRDDYLSKATLARVRKAMDRQAAKVSSDAPERLSAAKRQLAEIDRDLKAAVAEMRRTPADLYDLAVEEVRKLRTARVSAAAKIADLESVQASDSMASTVDALFARMVKQLRTADEHITMGEPSKARLAIRSLFPRIDVFFRHSKRSKITLCEFIRGVVRNADSDLRLQSSRTSQVCNSHWTFGPSDLPRLPSVAERYAAIVGQLFEVSGRPVTTADVAAAAGLSLNGARHGLRLATRAGLLRRSGGPARSLWHPIQSNAKERRRGTA